MERLIWMSKRTLVLLLSLICGFALLLTTPDAHAAPKKKKAKTTQKRKSAPARTPASKAKTGIKARSATKAKPEPRTKGAARTARTSNQKVRTRKTSSTAKTTEKSAKVRRQAKKTPPAASERAPAAAGQVTGSYAPSYGGGTGLAGTDDSEKALKISGQSRNLNMMLILRGENERTEFGETRKDYRQEVLATQY